MPKTTKIAKAVEAIVGGKEVQEQELPNLLRRIGQAQGEFDTPKDWAMRLGVVANKKKREKSPKAA